MSTILIRPYNPTDYTSVRALIMQLQAHEKTVNPNREAPEKIADEFADALAKETDTEKYQVFVADEDGTPVGFLAGYPTEHLDDLINIDKTYFIDDLVVSEEHRGEGIGKMLLDHAVAYAKSKGLQRLGLGVLLKNTSARDFYKKYGFEEETVELFKKIA